MEMFEMLIACENNHNYDDKILLCFCMIQECFETISTLISGSWIEVKELKWLISYMYNIGVAMFNMKQYDGVSN
jgi:hypothetical protein